MSHEYIHGYWKGPLEMVSEARNDIIFFFLTASLCLASCVRENICNSTAVSPSFIWWVSIAKFSCRSFFLRITDFFPIYRPWLVLFVSENRSNFSNYLVYFAHGGEARQAFALINTKRFQTRSTINEEQERFPCERRLYPESHIPGNGPGRRAR